MADHNDWSYWQAALTGQTIQTERGNPRTGFYRSQTGDEVIAIWRGDDGTVCCKRTKFGDGSRMDVDAIDDLFGFVCRYPISHELFQLVDSGGELPPEYGTRLSMKEIQAGVAWTPELGRKKLGLPDDADDTPPENPRAVPGDNNPPEELPPEKNLLKRIRTAAERVDAWLKSIGGIPKTKEEADRVADYATKFGNLEKEGDEAFKKEKEPWLEGSRAVDAKWKFRSEAGTLRKQYLAISNKWIDGEKARLAEEQRKQHEAAKLAAQREAEASGEPVAEIKEPEAPKVTVGNMRTVSQRERKVWIVTDPVAYANYLACMEPPLTEFLQDLGKYAQRQGAAGVAAPGITLEMKRSAA